VLSRFRFAVAAISVALLAVTISTTSAQAALGKVSGVTAAAEDNYNARLTARWKAVAGATYQVRWAASTKGLVHAKRISLSTARSTSPVLYRCAPSYVQVRAVKGGVVGPWSKPKAMRFHNIYPGHPTIRGTGLPNAVRLTWPYDSNATRYRVRWNAAPFGKFAGGDSVIGGWTNQYARSTVLHLSSTPRAGDKMMGVAYANPVYVQIDANHVCFKGIPHSTYVPVFPQAPDPGPGDNLRLGTYNTELFPNNTTAPGRINGLVKNVEDHNLTVVALQEANAATASSMESKLDARWKVAPSQPSSSQQILYDGNVFRVVASGSFDVPSYNTSASSDTLVTPWVRLRQIHPSQAGSQDLFVVSLHLSQNAAKSQMATKHDANVAANVALRGISAANTDDVPVVVAGDFRYLREPFNDVAGYVEGPPTFVRAGYYDALAAVVKNNEQYTTVNQHQNQVPSKAGVASRSDYIMLKGFHGSRAYTNVANWKYNGVFVTDHNLVYADITIPYQE
jgi:exonuclease III